MEELLKELQTDMEVELVSELHDDSDKALLFSKIKGAWKGTKARRHQ